MAVLRHDRHLRFSEPGVWHHREVIMQPRRAFQESFGFFLDQVIPVCQESEEYREFAAGQLAAVLLLADRVVAACDQQQDNGRVVEVCNHLPAAGDEGRGEELLAELERWLKGLWWLLDPDGWRSARDEGEAIALAGKQNRFNLFAALIALDLLTPAEANKHPKDYLTLPDRVRGYLLLAKEERNPTVHDGKVPRRDVLILRRQAAAIGLLAPVFKHFRSLRAALDRLVTTPLIEDTEADVNNGFSRFIQSVASERRRHLDYFAGRERWLKTVREHLEHTLREEGGYLLLSAPEGTGKSALAAKTSELLVASGVPLGPAAETVRRLAPWLPGPLLHMGKQSSDPDEIVRLLLAQANALLLRPVTASIGSPPGDTHTDAELDTPMLFRGKGPKAIERGTELFVPSAVTRVINEGRRPERLHRLIAEALERVRDERGTAILIVDALEEISRDGGNLDFLPPTLPRGVTALLTVRQNTPAEKWVKGNLHNVTALTLDGLERKDISQITGVSDEDEDGKAFNRQVFDRTTGLALAVRHIADEVRNCGGDFRQVVIAGRLDLLYRRQADAWRNARPEGFVGGLSEVLLLLSVFDPVSWLSREMIQGYLGSLGVKVLSPELDDALQPVATQLVGLKEDRLRLAVRAFGKYVREELFSRRDMVEGLRSVGKWLATDPDVLPTDAGAFLRYWGGPNRDSRFQKVAEETLELYREAKHWEALTFAAVVAHKSDQPLAPIAERALRVAAEAHYPPAMGRLGAWWLFGNSLKKDAPQGIEWLRLAAEAGETPAMEILSDEFLVGEQRNAEEGFRWLRAAVAAGASAATRVLGWRLLEGDEIPKDEDEGIRLLRKAASAGDKKAMGILGGQLLNRPGWATEPNEGRTWLVRSAEGGDGESRRILGLRLLTGDGLEASPKEGEQWLKRAAEAGHLRTMITLGRQLLHGRYLSKNLAEGARWIRQAAAKDPGAELALAEAILDKEVPAQNPNEAEELLRRCVERGNLSAMGVLGEAILDGVITALEPEEGQKWLRKAAAELPQAMTSLGQLILDGKIAPTDPDEALRLLTRALDKGAASAGTTLGYHLYANGHSSEALALFLRAFKLGSEIAGVNATYILRRSEATAPEDCPLVSALLAPCLEERNIWAIINHGLALAIGFQCPVDWLLADQLIGGIPSPPEEDMPAVLEWWKALADRSDPEGDLVLAWLARYGHAKDPDGFPLPERMARARRGPWTGAPEWLNIPASQTPPRSGVV